MRNGARGFCVLAVMAACAVNPGRAADYPPAIAAVVNHMTEVDYPEVFGDTSYVVKAEHAFTFDLDRDGQDEVVLHVTPHYRQSATLLFYRVAPDMKVTRLREGLAPGPLMPLSGDFLDGHTLGLSVDVDLGRQQQDEAARRKFINSAFTQGMSVVAYRDFLHLDNREGSPYYVDMVPLDVQPATKTCEKFEFSQINEATAGTVDGLGTDPVLAVWVSENVYLYRINAISPEGMLDKTLWTVKLPADFSGLVHPEKGGSLAYVTRDGQTKALAVACVANQKNNCDLKASP